MKKQIIPFNHYVKRYLRKYKLTESSISLPGETEETTLRHLYLAVNTEYNLFYTLTIREIVICCRLVFDTLAMEEEDKNAINAI